MTTDERLERVADKLAGDVGAIHDINPIIKALKAERNKAFEEAAEIADCDCPEEDCISKKVAKAIRERIDE